VPTYEWLARFKADFERLSPDQQVLFLLAVRQFVDDLKGGGTFRKGLRVKGVQGASGVFELTWAPDGRATFEYGVEVLSGEVHIVWRRVGTHAIFDRP
jgi:hypothetical protein